MEQEIIWILQTLILPPGGLVLMGLLGLMLSRRFIGKFILVLTLAALYLFSTGFASGLLMEGLETIDALSEKDIELTGAQAIVVLGGGRRTAAPEYGGDTLNTVTLERVRYAAWLARKTGLPVISSGGSPNSDGPAEAAIAREILEREFGVKVAATEERSLTTLENARLTKPLLEKLGIKRVLLVTHAWHMLRAMDVFEPTGIVVTPAPMGFAHKTSINPSTFRDWLPSARNLSDSSWAIHEYLGRLWYRIRG